MCVACAHCMHTQVLRAGLRGLDALVKSLPKERYPLHVTHLREQVQEVAAEWRASQLESGAVGRGEGSQLPAFCQPNGLGSIVAVHLQGLMTGTPELREQSAAALGEAVELTDAKSLKPYVIQITGPLIRIVGDRFPYGVKAAILHTLTLLIAKGVCTRARSPSPTRREPCGRLTRPTPFARRFTPLTRADARAPFARDTGAVLLKPFVPQLQTTFVKALADPTKLVRTRGAAALSRLVVLATRVEPLATELHTSLATAESGVQVSASRADAQRAMPVLSQNAPCACSRACPRPHAPLPSCSCACTLRVRCRWLCSAVWAACCAASPSRSPSRSSSRSRRRPSSSSAPTTTRSRMRPPRSSARARATPTRARARCAAPRVCMPWRSVHHSTHRVVCACVRCRRVRQVAPPR